MSGEGGRHWAGQPSCRFYELINRCPADPPAEKLPRQLHPEGRADGKLERALILGQEKKNIPFPPFLSKNMLGPFLSLGAIKTSCGSEQPPQPLPREKANKNRPGGGVSAMSRRWAQAPATSDLDLCPRWAPPNSLFILARAQGTRRHPGLVLLIPGAEEDERTREVGVIWTLLPHTHIPPHLLGQTIGHLRYPEPTPGSVLVA